MTHGLTGFRNLCTAALIYELCVAEPSREDKIFPASQDIFSRLVRLEVPEIGIGPCPDID
jgi:hypothetical protein